MPESHKLGQVPDGSIDPTDENNYKVMNDFLKGTMILVQESLLCSLIYAPDLDISITYLPTDFGPLIPGERLKFYFRNIGFVY